MPPYMIQRGIMAAKIESVSGVKETLAAGDAFMAYNIKFDPDHKTNKRDPVRPTFSQVQQCPGFRSAKMSFGTDLLGAAAAGNAPFWSPLAKGAALGETIVGGTSVTYAPASAGIPHLTLGRYIVDEANAALAKINNVIGAHLNLKYALEVGKPGLLNWEATGCDWDEVDGSMLAGISIPTILPPTVLGITVTLDGVALGFSKLDIDLGNKLVLVTDPSAASGYRPCGITGREPKLTVDPLAILKATKDYLDLWRVGTQVAFSIALGTTPGNIHTITGPKCQITDIKENPRDNYLARTFTVALNMNTSGDDELSHAIT